jgi:hypothetical protein
VVVADIAALLPIFVPNPNPPWFPGDAIREGYADMGVGDGVGGLVVLMVGKTRFGGGCDYSRERR